MSFHIDPYRREKTCAVCGETFIAKSWIAKYCPNCREKARKEVHLRAQTRCYEKIKSDPEAYQRYLEIHRKSDKKCYWFGKRKKYQQHYAKTEKGREVNRKARKKYREKNRELMRLNRRIRYYDECCAYWNSREQVTVDR